MSDLPRRAVRGIRAHARRLSPSYRRRTRFNLQNQHDPSWQRRAEQAVDMWKGHRGPGDERGDLRVADFGCGNERLHEVLAQRLGDSLLYQGYDLEPQRSTTIKLDLQRELPDQRFDLGFALGLLEYLEDLGGFLCRLKVVAPCAVVTYVVSDSPDHLTDEERLARGWRTHLTLDHFEGLCRTTGWEPLDFELIDDDRTGLWLLRSSAVAAR